MNIMNSLTARYLRLNKKRTMITLFGIIVSVAMITAVAGFAFSFLSYIRQGAIAEHGEWHVFYYAYDEQTAQKIASEPLFDRTEITQIDDEDDPDVGTYQVSCYTGKRLNSSFAQQAYDLYERYEAVGFSYNSDLIKADGLFLNDNFFTTLVSVSVVLILLIMGGSVIVIANAFYISSAERTRQYGVLKSMGATRQQVRNSVMFEGIILAAIAIPIGLIAGYIGEAVVLYIADGMLRDFVYEGVELKAVMSLPAFGIAVVFSLTTILLSAWFPAHKAGKVSPVDAIRQSQAVKIKPGVVKTSKLTEWVFGFEGTLAAKAIRRSRGKYRAAVLSLVMSIVLFMGAASFGEMLTRSIGMTVNESEYNVDLYFSSGHKRDLEEMDALLEGVISLPGVESYSSTFSVGVKVPVTADMYTRDGKMYIYDDVYNEISETGESYVSLLALSNGEIEELCAELGLDFQAMLDPERPQAILVNNMGPFQQHDEQGNYRLVQITPYRNLVGRTLSMGMDEDSIYSADWDIQIAGEVKTHPLYSDADMHYNSAIELIVSRTVLYTALVNALDGEVPSLYQQVRICASDSDAYVAALLEADLLDEYDNYYNADEADRESTNLLFVIKLFVYGFVVLLSVIAVTSVIGTISTSISMRRREFAMLQSVGMTPAGLRRMLNLESVLYGVKALALGLPLGVGVSYLIYHFVISSFYFSFPFPWKSIGVVVVAVMLITFSTMHYARLAQRRESIVDVLRSELT